MLERGKNGCAVLKRHRSCTRVGGKCVPGLVAPLTSRPSCHLLGIPGAIHAHRQASTEQRVITMMHLLQGGSKVALSQCQLTQTSRVPAGGRAAPRGGHSWPFRLASNDGSSYRCSYLTQPGREVQPKLSIPLVRFTSRSGIAGAWYYPKRRQQAPQRGCHECWQRCAQSPRPDGQLGKCQLTHLGGFVPALDTLARYVLLRLDLLDNHKVLGQVGVRGVRRGDAAPRRVRLE